MLIPMIVNNFAFLSAQLCSHAVYPFLFFLLCAYIVLLSTNVYFNRKWLRDYKTSLYFEKSWDPSIYSSIKHRKMEEIFSNRKEPANPKKTNVYRSTTILNFKVVVVGEISKMKATPFCSLRESVLYSFSWRISFT